MYQNLAAVDQQFGSEREFARRRFLRKRRTRYGLGMNERQVLDKLPDIADNTRESDDDSLFQLEQQVERLIRSYSNRTTVQNMLIDYFIGRIGYDEIAKRYETAQSTLRSHVCRFRNWARDHLQ